MPLPKYRLRVCSAGWDSISSVTYDTESDTLGKGRLLFGRSLVVDEDGAVVWGRPLPLRQGWDTVESF